MTSDHRREGEEPQPGPTAVLEALLDESDHPVAILDRDGRISQVNARAGELLGLPHDAVGIPFDETSWSPPDGMDEWLSRVRDGEAVEYETDAREAGVAGTIASRIRPVTEPDGEVSGLLVVGHPADEGEQFSEERQIEEFVEVLTHDIRNPLSVAAGYLELVRASGDKAAIENAQQALDRIESLIDEVQASVLEGDREPDERPVDLSIAAEAAWTNVDTGDANLEVDGAMVLRADPRQLQRLLENLFRNAIQHGGNGDTASLRVRVVAGADGFTVEDDGVGLPDSIQDRLFERGVTAAPDGTGLGLSIVATIAEAHGWAVTAEERETGGARFRFSQVLQPTETVIEMSAGGDDIWHSRDQGHFYFTETAGDFDVRVNVPLVRNTHAWAKGGIMVRAALDADAPNVFLRRRPNGASTVQWRSTTGADSASLTSEEGRSLLHVEHGERHHPWLRLHRTGDTLRAYTAPAEAPEEWTLLAEFGGDVVSLPDQVYLGLAGTSHNRVEPTKIRFSALDGIEPDRNVDLDGPFRSGSISWIQPSLIPPATATDVTASSMTLRAETGSMDWTDDMEYRFVYRPILGETWQSVHAGRISEGGALQARLTGLAPRQYYEIKLVGEFENTTLESATATVVATDGEGTGSAAKDEPRSSAPVDPADGFATVGGWVDDDTPIIRIDSPDRDQLATALAVEGPRVIVFETSGTIELGNRDLTISEDQCWIAGQTAPSPGITLTHGRVIVDAADCILQHLRIRPGDADTGRAEAPTEAIRTADATSNLVIDHCTTTWATNVNQAVGHLSTTTTVSNCLIAESLFGPSHHTVKAGRGTLIGDEAAEVCFAGNLWAHNPRWNPQINEAATAVLANNVHYHYGTGLEIAAGAAASIVGDVFDRPSGDGPDVFGDGAAYIEDTVHADGTAAIGGTVERLPDRTDWPENLSAIDSADVVAAALEHAGARPADRTPTDERIIESVRNDTGGFLASELAVESDEPLAEITRELDIPATNLRGWLREQARQVEP